MFLFFFPEMWRLLLLTMCIQRLESLRYYPFESMDSQQQKSHWWWPTCPSHRTTCFTEEAAQMWGLMSIKYQKNNSWTRTWLSNVSGFSGLHRQLFDTCQIKHAAKTDFFTERNIKKQKQTGVYQPRNAARIWPCYKEPEKKTHTNKFIPVTALCAVQDWLRMAKKWHIKVFTPLHSFERTSVVLASWNWVGVFQKGKVAIRFAGESNQWNFVETKNKPVLMKENTKVAKNHTVMCFKVKKLYEETNSYHTLDPESQFWDIGASRDVAIPVSGDTWNAAFYL